VKISTYKKRNIEYLVFDVETTGFPKIWKAPVSKLSNWPRIVQIGWYAFDKQENCVESKSYIVKPEGFEIPADSVKIHGITTQFATETSREIGWILHHFAELLKSSRHVVAHNLNFDKKVVQSEFIRADIRDYFDKTVGLCTKEIGTEICKIPGKYGYKWPTLKELYDHLFDDKFEVSHNALNDAKAAADCFLKLKKMNAF